MGLLQKFFGPGHSVILAFDHIDMETLEELTQALDEVGEFYRFVPLSQLAAPSQLKRQKGCAAVVFKQARASVFLRAIPELKAREIPFALLLDPDCIGTNRLPVAEEQEILRASHESTEELLQPAYLENAWTEGQSADSLRERFREKFGSLNVERLDPTRFFTTWGKIAELPTQLAELGLRFTTRPGTESARDLAMYARKTSGRPLDFGYLPSEIPGTFPPSVYQDLAVKFVLTNRSGIVAPSTSLWELPLFALEKHEPAGSEALPDANS